MNTSLSDAIKEAYACCPTNIAVLETLSLSHPDLPDGTIYMVQGFTEVVATLETAEEVTFEAIPFRFVLPAAGENGRQELTLTIDNVDRRISDFIIAVKESSDPVTVTYRPYLSNDLSGPQMDPPLTLSLQSISVNVYEVSGRATFADVLNRPFPSDFYTRSRFPSLGT